jgi:hypothetical protein
MNIFNDNNFIAKSKMKEEVSVNEQFVTDIEIDPSVKVEYKSLDKFKELKNG